VWITLREQRGRRHEDIPAAQLLVEDDGIGFDVSKPIDSHHYGLQQMKERVISVGGILKVDATPGIGTRIVATIPLASKHNP
jgi:signal transduction histidine kinase